MHGVGKMQGVETMTPRSRRLSSYARVAGVQSVAGLAASMVAGQTMADLQIWSVGQALPQTGWWAQPSADLQLIASFKASFQINFFGTGSNGDQNFWGPNANLSFINYGSAGRNAPANWDQSVLIGSTALSSSQSAGYSTAHFWRAAISTHGTAHDIENKLSRGATGALGIRFSSGSDYYYGWVELSMDATSNIVTVERWALENTANTAAQYTPGGGGGGGGGGGAVPGLGGLAVLALGAGGVRSRRSRVA